MPKTEKAYQRMSEYQKMADSSTNETLPTTEMENERRFALTLLPGFSLEDVVGRATRKKRIKQGYTEIGVRLQDSVENGIHNYRVSYKERVGAEGVVRIEEGKDIEREEFKSWWRARVGDRFIRKTRYFLSSGEGHEIQLDVFMGQQEGILMAEVEFKTEQEALAFKPEGEIFDMFTVEDITADKGKTNHSFAKENARRAKAVRAQFAPSSLPQQDVIYAAA